MSARQSLGRGFDALIPKNLDRSILQEDSGRIQNLLISEIVPNQDQPRRSFEQESINELAISIKRHGVMQPIIVTRKKGQNQYQIVAGERRWRAAGHAKLESIPAIVRSLEELEQIEMALIENIQRVDLSPLEQAMAVYRLQHQFNLSLKEVAQRLGKALSTVSNIGRLLQLPDEARQALEAGKITEGHARAILALKGKEEKQRELLSCILNNNWTVRQAEEFVLNDKRGALALKSGKLGTLTKDLSTKLKAPVKIKQTASGGQIIISFKNEADLDRLNEFIRKS
jgi:ParB family chromosome partitioning protein